MRFWSCDLDFDPVTLIFEVGQDILNTYLYLRIVSPVIALQTDRHTVTDRHTHRYDWTHYHVAFAERKNKSFLWYDWMKWIFDTIAIVAQCPQLARHARIRPWPVNCNVNDALGHTTPEWRAARAASVRQCHALMDWLLDDAPYLVVDRIEVRAVWWPGQIKSDVACSRHRRNVACQMSSETAPCRCSAATCTCRRSYVGKYYRVCKKFNTLSSSEKMF